MSKQSSDGTINMTKTAIWQMVSVFLFVLLVISVFTGGFGYASSSGSGTVEAPDSNSGDSVNLDGEHLKGDPDAPVTIVEWSDFECPFCARFYSQTYKQIVEEYVDTGKANVVFKHFPLGFHQNAQPAAIATECAAEQGKFWEMHDMLFERGVEGGKSTYKGYAQELGLDTEQFNSCLDSDKYLSKVNADMAEGQRKGIRGTPGFLINGQPLSGAQPFAVFQATIESELN